MCEGTLIRGLALYWNGTPFRLLYITVQYKYSIRGFHLDTLTIFKAFRMMKDIGIHLFSEDLDLYQSLTAEDKEVRRNLWWSAHTWDKLISLALGRGPSWEEYGVSKPGPLSEPNTNAPYPLRAEQTVDDTSDEQLWTPFQPTMWELASLKEYPLTKLTR